MTAKKMLEESFPFSQPRTNQKKAMELISKHPRLTLEMATGEGKTALGYSLLRSLQEKSGGGALLYVVPTKALIKQVHEKHPDIQPLYGRSKYECLYYQEEGEDLNASEVPCSLIDCPHRDPDIGEGVEPCPYYEAKRNVERGEIVVCTMAYFLLNKVFQKWPKNIEGLVIDEVHRLPEFARLVFRYDITDYNLKRLRRFLADFKPKQAHKLAECRDELESIAKSKGDTEELLSDFELEKFLDKLEEISLDGLRADIRARLNSGDIDPVESRDDLRMVEVLTNDLRRYISSLRYALAEVTPYPLSYVYAYYEKDPDKRVNYKLCVRSYKVSQLIRKALQAKRILAYSATIGDPEIFGFESGISFPFESLSSSFPEENARIFLPENTPNLAYEKSTESERQGALEQVAEAVKKSKEEGYRSLVVTVSNQKRKEFLNFAEEMGLEALSYERPEVNPEATSEDFKEGAGDCLVGTAGNYSHGIDLPGDTAPVIFFLKPSYAPPSSPRAQFERDRFKKKGQMDQYWRLKNWRATIQALQVRGRNIRSGEDLGVAFFVSQQFGNLFPGGLPEWLKETWQNKGSLDEQIGQAMDFLKTKY